MVVLGIVYKENWKQRNTFKVISFTLLITFAHWRLFIFCCCSCFFCSDQISDEMKGRTPSPYENSQRTYTHDLHKCKNVQALKNITND